MFGSRRRSGGTKPRGVADGQPTALRDWVTAAQFKAKAGQVLALPGADGGPGLAIFGLGAKARPDGMALRALPAARIVDLSILRA